MLKVFLYFIFSVIVFGSGCYLFYVYKFRYKTVKSHEVLFISGRSLKGENVFTDDNGRSVMIQRGGGYRLKMFQTAEKTSLHSFQISVETPKIYVQNGIPIIAVGIATIRIADRLEDIVLFAEQFLGKSEEEIKSELRNVLSTNTRSLLGTLSVEDLLYKRKEFNEAVSENLRKELAEMGFSLVSFGLEDVRDAGSTDYLANLGRAKMAEVKKIAETAEAEAKKIIRIDKAENEKNAKTEELKREMEIDEIQREVSLKKEKNQAIVLQEEIKTKSIELIEKQNMEIEIKKKEFEKEILENENLLKQEEIKKKNHILQAQKEAEMKEIEAASEKAREILNAEAEATAMELKKEAENETFIKRGKAEVELIALKGEAEAKSKLLMAQAVNEYGEIAVIEMITKVLPEMATALAKSYENVGEIKIVDMGGSSNEGSGLNSLPSSLLHNMTSLQTVFEESVGIDLKEILVTHAAKGRNYNPDVVSANIATNKVVEKDTKIISDSKVEAETETMEDVENINKSLEDNKID